MGTHEFYETRAELTKRLIVEKGFRAIAVEADWPDALRVNRYVHGTSDDSDADVALGDFTRFPRWMWRNGVVLEFVEWLRQWNAAHEQAQVGFYGMDLYGLHASISDVLEYLDRVDPGSGAAGTGPLRVLRTFWGSADVWLRGEHGHGGKPCEDEVVDQLMELRRRSPELISADGPASEAELFYAEQNARLIANAKRYYRAMFGGRASSWNLRDEHMAGTIESLRVSRCRRR